MPNTSSTSLIPSSSESTSSQSRSSSHRSTISNALASAFQSRKTRGVIVDESVHNNSHDNTYIINGQANITYGSNAVQNIQVGLDVAEILVMNMKRSQNAEFDMDGNLLIKRESCTPQTCQYILKDLKKWCKRKVDLLLYWLNGMPGTGKTTIVYTICLYLRKRGLLGASFFCSRSMSDCQDMRYIFPTIAFQLARRFPAFKKELGNALQRDPDIHNRPLHAQLQGLIIEPSKAKEDSLPPGLIVVLDALDECTGDPSSFLEVLVKYTPQLPFRLLMTSRPECVIHSTLESSSPSPMVEKFVLHEVEKSIVKEDIIRFLRSKLSPLPDASTIDALADYSGSAFILAATVVRLVMDKLVVSSDRLKRIESILRVLRSKGASLVTEPLDKVYTEVLSKVTESRNELFEEEIQGIKDVVFTIICVREPLTREAIGLLWGLNGSEVESRLNQLRSVIFVPEDTAKPITIFHASFAEYLTDKSRSHSWYCDETIFHDRLAAMCFKTINRHLRQNICQLADARCLPNEEVNQEVIEATIGVGLAYSCANWARHLELSASLLGYSSAIQEAHEFVKYHLFHWFECLSLLGCLFVCEGALETLEDLLKGSETASLVREAREFLQLNYDVINYSAFETYRSALVWVPTTSSLRIHYAELWKKAGLPKVLQGLATDWTESSRAVKTRSGGVNTVSVTSDGSRVIFGSQDGTVHLWNALSYREERVFSGHTAAVQCVAVSSDGSRIFSASHDQTVRIWDVNNPTPITIFSGHSEPLECITISKDGEHICSCDILGNIIVWETRTAKILWSTKQGGPYSRNHKVSFLSADSRLASVCDRTLQILNAKTGAVISSFEGHDGNIQDVAASPGDNHLITGSADTTAIVWDSSSGKRIRILRGHTGAIKCVALFHDNKRAITGSVDKSLRVWDIATGETLVSLTGHTQLIWSVALFPDDRWIVSGSWDDTIMLWNLRVPESMSKEKRRWIPWGRAAVTDSSDVWKGRFLASSNTLLCLCLNKRVHLLDTLTLIQQSALNTGEVFSAAFSSQGSRLATASNNMTIWEISNNRKLLTMKGHKYSIDSIMFSHDDKRVVTGSSDGTARIWCAVTGAEQHVLRLSRMIYSVAFSPDDTLVVTTSENRPSIRLWNSQTGDILEEPRFRRPGDDWANSAIFSSDGRFLITSKFRGDTTLIWDSHNGNLSQILGGHWNWTCLPSGASYTIYDSSWVCKTTDPETPPAKLCWIPPKYRPIKDRREWKPIAFSSTAGDRILLNGVNGVVLLALSGA